MNTDEKGAWLSEETVAKKGLSYLLWGQVVIRGSRPSSEDVRDGAGNPGIQTMFFSRQNCVQLGLVELRHGSDDPRQRLEGEDGIVSKRLDTHHAFFA